MSEQKSLFSMDSGDVSLGWVLGIPLIAGLALLGEAIGIGDCGCWWESE